MKHTNILVILFLLWTLSVIGQDNQEIKTKNWKIGGHFMPSIVFNHESYGEIAFAPVTGLKIEKQLSDRLTLGIVINYFKTNLYHGSWWGGFCDSPIGDCHWYSETNYLEIPLNLKFYYSKEKHKINSYFTFGAITSLSIKSTNTKIHVIDNKSTTTIYEYNKLKYQQNYLSGTFGTEFKLADNVEVFIEPSFRYSFQALINWFDFTNYTILVGFGVGLNYKL